MVLGATPRIAAACSGEKPSTAVSRKVWRGIGVIVSRRWSLGESESILSYCAFNGTMFQICESIL